jgi:hypothetical protein
MRYALGFNSSHWTPRPYKYSRRYPLRLDDMVCHGKCFEAGRNLVKNLAPNLAQILHETKKNRDFRGGFVQDSVQDFFPLKMVRILHKNLAKTL